MTLYYVPFNPRAPLAPLIPPAQYDTASINWSELYPCHKERMAAIAAATLTHYESLQQSLQQLGK